jgi:preprotein translocase subunit YajC
MPSLIIIVVLFAAMWFFLIRPQRRRQTETELMLGTLEVGDEVVTAGGIYGTITELEESDVRVEIAPGLVVKVARRAIAGRTDDDEGEDEVEAEEPSGLAEEGEPTAADRG